MVVARLLRYCPLSFCSKAVSVCRFCHLCRVDTHNLEPALIRLEVRSPPNQQVLLGLGLQKWGNGPGVTLQACCKMQFHDMYRSVQQETCYHC